jgi:NAD(P)-dependent dehydrogenase (short-subunit alcohol dehydrogenase family)
MKTLLITGASRGIGLEHVRQALVAGEHVIAACRAPDGAVALQQLLAEHGAAKLRLEALDVASGASIAALAARLAGTPIDRLINNAGIYGYAPWPKGAAEQSLAAMDYDLWDDVLRINLVGPFRVTAGLLPNLLAGGDKQVIMMSSDLGSIANNTQGTSHAYRSSKAAINMITRGLAIDLKDSGVTVVSMAPGWVRTDLGGSDGHWSVEDSVAGQRRVLATLGLADSGSFVDLTGKAVPW